MNYAIVLIKYGYKLINNRRIGQKEYADILIQRIKFKYSSLIENGCQI